MKYLIPLFSLLLIILSSTAQVKRQGTLIISAKCTNGIILIADSRTVIKTYDDSILAYIDNSPKIYPLSKYVFALAGDISDGVSYFSRMVKKFIDAGISYDHPGDAIAAFQKFVQEKYPFYVNVLKDNILFCIGYYNQKQVITVLRNGNIKNTHNIWNASDLDGVYSLNILDSINKTTVNKLIPVLEKTIKKYISVFHRERDIGGKNSILYIDSTNQWSFIKNNFTKNITLSECDEVKAYFTGKHKYSYIKPENKKIVDSLFKIVKDTLNCH